MKKVAGCPVRLMVMLLQTLMNKPSLKYAKAGERFVGWPASQYWGADHVAVSRGHNTAGETEQLRLEVPVLGNWPSY